MHRRTDTKSLLSKLNHSIHRHCCCQQTAIQVSEDFSSIHAEASHLLLKTALCQLLHKMQRCQPNRDAAEYRFSIKCVLLIKSARWTETDWLWQTQWLFPSFVHVEEAFPLKYRFQNRPTSILAIRLHWQQWTFLGAKNEVHLSAWNNSAPTGRIFMKFDIWKFFENQSKKKSKLH